MNNEDATSHLFSENRIMSLLTLSFGLAQAGEKGARMTVSATVTTSCSISAAAAVAGSYYAPSTVSVSAMATLSVNCSAAEPATITFGHAIHAVSGPTFISATSATTLVARSQADSPGDATLATISF